MKDRIIEYAKQVGASDAGVCKNSDGRFAVVCLFSYKTDTVGNLAMYARTIDYHKIVPQKLALISDFIKSLDGSAACECFSDIGPLIDKDLAYRAGLGFYGKNSLIISPRFGSFCVIGYVLTNIELECDSPIETSCGDCDLCVRACVGGALRDGFDATRCASAISQKKGELDDWEIAILKKSGKIFGCDMCQSVCPYNRIEASPMAEFRENLICSLKKEDIEGLSERKFRQKYADRAFSWRGKAPLARNLDIIGDK